jgi:hypothetical protein
MSFTSDGPRPKTGGKGPKGGKGGRFAGVGAVPVVAGDGFTLFTRVTDRGSRAGRKGGPQSLPVSAHNNLINAALSTRALNRVRRLSSVTRLGASGDKAWRAALPPDSSG